MIRYQTKIYEGFKICPLTGKIFNEKTGKIQVQQLHKNGYLYWRGNAVHCMMAHTFIGYFEGCAVHHKDGNQMNNILSNLQLLTGEEHSRLHGKRNIGERNWMYGRHMTDEEKKLRSEKMKGRHWTMSKQGRKNIGDAQRGKKLQERQKEKISLALKGKKHSDEHNKKVSEALKGRHWYNNGVNEVRVKECPGEGWVKGTLPNKHKPQKE